MNGGHWHHGRWQGPDPFEQHKFPCHTASWQVCCGDAPVCTSSSVEAVPAAAIASSTLSLSRRGRLVNHSLLSFSRIHRTRSTGPGTTGNGNSYVQDVSSVLCGQSLNTVYGIHYISAGLSPTTAYEHLSSVSDSCSLSDSLRYQARVTGSDGVQDGLPLGVELLLADEIRV